MPGAIVTPRPSEDTAEGNDAEFAETVPLILPSSLDHEQQKRICLQQVAAAVVTTVYLKYVTRVV
jgi:hypothetical protein